MNSDAYGNRNFVRLSPELFTYLVERVNPVIEKQKNKILPATSSWIEDSHHPQIPGHRGLIQENDVWLQGHLQHHITVCARGV